MFRIFRLITSLWFYVGIACMILIVFGSQRMDVSGFRRRAALSVSTSLRRGEQGLAPRKKLQDTSIALVYANISLGNNGSHSFTHTTSIGSPEGDDVSKALFFASSLQKINQTDIVGLLSRATDRTTIMQTFLNQSDTTMRQASITEQQLQSTISSTNNQLVVCKTDKTTADSRYNEGLRSNNATLVQNATDQATKANECIATLTTRINSYQGVLDRLTKHITTTQNYIAIIRTHQTTLIAYPDLINSSTPSALLQLQKDLNSLTNK